MAKRITIIGTGLIGGSLGLAIKAAGIEGLEVVGHDRDRGSANQAQKLGAIDRAEHNLPRAVEGAGMVIIATRVLSVREVMQQIAPDLAEGAVVTDTASTKAAVMQWAHDVLPDSVSFVGGHPMAGKETAGVQAAEAGLFRAKPYCICPSVNASDVAIKSVLSIVSLAGAEPVFIDPAEHDQYAAAVSHLPIMLSTALFALLRESPAWPDMAVMASSGFRDVTRLASGDPIMSHDIWVTNREAVIHWLERLEGRLQHFRSLLQDAKDEALLELFMRAQFEREEFLAHPPERPRGIEADRPDPGKAVLDLIVGGMLADRMRQAQKIPEMMAQAPPRQEGDEPKLSRADKMAEDIRRDIEKLEEKRAAKQVEAETPDGD